MSKLTTVAEQADAYDPEPCFEHGHWYLREQDNALFIVPDDRHGLADTYGSDDETFHQLNEHYRNQEGSSNAPDWFDSVDVTKVAHHLGFTYVHPWQRRFDSQCGWYIA